MFIQIVQGACTRQDEMRRLVDGWCADMETKPGWLGGTFGFTDDSSFCGVIRFENEALCRQNALRPAAAAWWAEAAMLFDKTPRIHESTDVTMMMDGGSDDAGFVQIMQGKVKNPALLRTMTGDSEMVNMLHQARPEIIGGTMIIEEDGTFTETVAFTDERAARHGEAVQMPAQLQDQFASAIEDVEYLDLHRPWFGSRR